MRKAQLEKSVRAQLESDEATIAAERESLTAARADETLAVTRADEAVASYRELDAQAKAARDEFNAFGKAHSIPHGTYGPGGHLEIVSPGLLENLRRELEVAEAEAKRELAAHEAALALDAAELAQGDHLARTRDLHTLRGDIVALDAEVAAAEKALRDAQERRANRVRSATWAGGRVAQRRAAAALPYVPNGFAPQFVQLNATRTFLDFVDDAISRGIPAPDASERIEGIQRKIIECAARLETDVREREAEAKDIENDRVYRAEKAERATSNAAAQRRAFDAETQSIVREQEDLAAAYLAR